MAEARRRRVQVKPMQEVSHLGSKLPATEFPSSPKFGQGYD